MSDIFSNPLTWLALGLWTTVVGPWVGKMLAKCYLRLIGEKP